MRLQLPNNCQSSQPQVFPKNWKKPGATDSIDWFIFYRFYDPTRPKPKLVAVRGMNHVKGITARRELTQVLLNDEIDALVNLGYNPFTKKFHRDNDTDMLLDGNMPLKISSYFMI